MITIKIGTHIRFNDSSLNGYILHWDMAAEMWVIVGFDGLLYYARTQEFIVVSE